MKLLVALVTFLCMFPLLFAYRGPRLGWRAPLGCIERTGTSLSAAKRSTKVAEKVALITATKSTKTEKKTPPVAKDNIKAPTRSNNVVQGPLIGKSLVKSADQVSFVVYCEPQPLQRHRVLRTGISYNPSSKQQKAFLEASRAFLPDQPLDGPLEARLVFYFKRPLNHYGTGKNSNVLKADVELWHSKRKDVDNLVKFVLDALNKVAYEDDGQVAQLSTAKLYTDSEPRVEVYLRKMQETDLLFAERFSLAAAHEKDVDV